MNLLTIIIAIGIGLVIWTTLMSIIRAVATPPPAVDPEDVVETKRRFRCSFCGTQVTMTLTNVGEPKPPRHCREEMDEVPVS